jgi:hypothetical protein
MPAPRSFKTKWFSKAAKKHGISDAALCQALTESRKGQADDLGGGVFKKRLNDNEDRSIILAKGGQFWIYQYLYAKKDRENIDSSELKDFRKLAKSYEGLTDKQLKELLDSGELVEICT